MHRVALSIGCVPLDEPFARCRITKDWVWLQSLETATYRAALIARFGLPPDGFELQVRSHDAAAGVGTAIEARFDADDADCLDYYEQVDRGLEHWSDAKFTAPVRYDFNGVEERGSRRFTDDCIVEAIMAAYQAIGRGEPGPIARTVADNHTGSYESLAGKALDRLFALALGTSNVR